MWRIAKLGIISIVLFFCLITIISLFIPSRIRISKAINLAAQNDSILNPVRDIEAWKKWYPGFDTIPVISLEKNGEQIIKAKVPGAEIVLNEYNDSIVNASFIADNKRPVQQTWRRITYPAADSITLQWYTEFKLRWYPWEKFSSLMFEGRYGGQMEKGLENLKKLIQNHSSNN
ncbi:MAG TPA: SRPBCC family protein [Chitinophagaceae bacterium]|nr:SRPBCC family protein [Chitinophagaceae bacterium]HPG10461.1 SRPBCC family protein [Chitinophagaceae bacterium]HRX94602.1 SRPBCC family protein [Chitinophagaceae bacterium]